MLMKYDNRFRIKRKIEFSYYRFVIKQNAKFARIDII